MVVCEQIGRQAKKSAVLTKFCPCFGDDDDDDDDDVGGGGDGRLNCLQ